MLHLDTKDITRHTRNEHSSYTNYLSLDIPFLSGVSIIAEIKFEFG